MKAESSQISKHSVLFCPITPATKNSTQHITSIRDTFKIVDFLKNFLLSLLLQVHCVLPLLLLPIIAHLADSIS